MVEPTNFRKFSLNEKLNFSNEVIPVVEPVLGEQPGYKELVAEVKTSRDNLMKSSEGLSHPELTEEVNEGDNLRDGGINGVKGNATRSLNRKDPNWVAAGKLVLQAFHEFGEDMAYMSLANETAAIDKFLAEVDRNAELKAAITTIQSDVWLQDIRDGQQIVRAAIAKRDASNASNVLPSAYDAAKPLGASIDKLFRYINMKIEFEPKPELVDLSHRLNEIIARYKQVVKLRQTLREQGKEENQDKK
jgi:hypothetical protein